MSSLVLINEKYIQIFSMRCFCARYHARNKEKCRCTTSNIHFSNETVVTKCARCRKARTGLNMFQLFCSSLSLRRENSLRHLFLSCSGLVCGLPRGRERVAEDKAGVWKDKFTVNFAGTPSAVTNIVYLFRSARILTLYSTKLILHDA
jgi:hypothetical protein